MPVYKTISFSFISLLSILSVPCKNEVAAVADNVKPGRRVYTWTVYTLITGTSPTDIWVCSYVDAKNIFFPTELTSENQTATLG